MKIITGDVIRDKAIEVAILYGGIDGDHHKAWVIDNMVRILAGVNYQSIIEYVEKEGYDWDIGVAP